MNASILLDRGRLLITENSTTILTAIGVAGTGTTAYLTGKASFKAVRILDDANVQHRAETQGEEWDIGLREKVKLVWQDYIPAAGVGVTTVTCIIMANRMSAKEVTALATAYGLSERAFSEYKTKVVDKIGENKERAVRDEIAQDRVNANPITNNVIITGTGQVLCYDMLTDRYFMSSMEEIKGAQNKVNEEIIQGHYASLGSFYDKIGLRPAGISEEVGWNSNNLLEVLFSTAMSTDNRPCIAIDFAHAPIAEYQRVY